MLISILIIISSLAIILALWIYFNLYKDNKQLKKDFSLFKEHSEIAESKAEEWWKKQFDAWCITKEKEIRKDSLTRSRNIIRGQATEHLSPFMIKGYSPKDFRFLGNPIDFIIYDGLGEVTDGNRDSIKSIIFLDIKTGNSQLNKVQRRIRDCVLDGRIEFLVFNPDKGEK